MTLPLLLVNTCDCYSNRAVVYYINRVKVNYIFKFKQLISLCSENNNLYDHEHIEACIAIGFWL